jgi:hypothetical protein
MVIVGKTGRLLTALGIILALGLGHTVLGKLRFDGPNNYGDDLIKIKQVQDGRWVVVWPKEFAAPGARLQSP